VYRTGKARAGAKGKLRADTRSLKKLTKHVQASLFLLQFAKWQQKLQKRLRIANTADNTLAALRLWAEYLFYDSTRHAVVLYVIKQLKTFMPSSKQQQCDDMHVLREWSLSLHKAAQSAADKLKEVYRSSTLQNTYITILRSHNLLV
jgi:dTDP-4-amino-4,6-dideoxygalactose transaminase